MLNIVDDCWHLIINHLNCYSILSLSLTCHYFNNDIKHHHWFNKRKYKDYPQKISKLHDLTYLFKKGEKIKNIYTIK